MSVIIDGKEYVLADANKDYEAMKLLREVYGTLWTEAFYDPECEKTRNFALPLAEKMQRANAVLGFKT